MTVHILTINSKHGWFIEDSLSRVEVYESREKGLEAFQKFIRKVLTDLTDERLINGDRIDFCVHINRDKFMISEDLDSDPYCVATLKEYHVQ